MNRAVVWDEENLHHLLVERAERRITPEEVEDVLTDPDTGFEPVRAGRYVYIGRTAAGRYLAVVALGSSEVRPETAWQITEEQWREAHA